MAVDHRQGKADAVSLLTAEFHDSRSCGLRVKCPTVSPLRAYAHPSQT